MAVTISQMDCSPAVISPLSVISASQRSSRVYLQKRRLMINIAGGSSDIARRKSFFLAEMTVARGKK